MTTVNGGDRIAGLLAALSPEQRALLASRLHAVAEPIAVIGMGCRFPGGAHDAASYWQLLQSGTDGVREIPADRFDVDAVYDATPGARGKTVTRWAGLVDEVDAFDCGFFGIAPREAAAMDAQHRILLEVLWESLDDAGQTIEGLRGSNTGVFVGIYGSEFSVLHGRNEDVDMHAAGGAQHSVGVSRISYLLDLRGPNVAVDTACSSSLVAIHLACQSLRLRECDVALAGGVNAILSAAPMIALSQAHAMARDGRCKTFDDRADGFVRGEGAGVVVLRRLADALRAGDRVLAVVRGSAVNQDGRTNFLSAPNGLAQQAVIRAALDSAGMDAARIGYVEAHGTGTALGDPIELEALAAVFGRGSRRTPCAIGSVKTNIGHLEAAAGVAGFMKAVLALRHGTIPPHLHFRSLNHLVTLDPDRFVIPGAPIDWPRASTPRAAGVSSFSFGGTNAHVILEEAPAAEHRDQPAGDTPVVLCISARGEPALRALAARYRDALAPGGTLADVPLADVAYTAAVRRTHHPDRLAIVGRTADEIVERLDRYLAGAGTADGLFAGCVDARTREISLIFGEQGLELATIAKSQYAGEPVFRAAFDEAVRAFEPHLARPLLDVLVRGESGAHLNEALTPPATFAIQLALAAQWRSWGVTPDAVMGSGVGEMTAAQVAGLVTLADAARLVAVNGAASARPELTASVRYPDAAATSGADGAAVFLEIGRPSLEPGVTTLAGRNGRRPTVVSSLRDGCPASEAMHEALAALHVAGVPVDWSRLHARRRVVSLPSYGWQRRRFPIDGNAARRPPQEPAPVGLVARRVLVAGSSDLVFERQLDADSPAFLRDHTILDAVIVPATAYFEMIRQALRDRLGTDALVFRKVELREACILSPGQPRVLQLVVRSSDEGDLAFQIWSRPSKSATPEPSWVVHVVGGVGRAEPSAERPPERIDTIRARARVHMPGPTLYEHARRRGGALGARFQGVAQLWRGDGEALGEIASPDALADELHEYLLHPALLDTAVQLVVFAAASEATTDAYLPIGLEEVRFTGASGTHWWGHVEVQSAGPQADTIRGNVCMWNDEGRTVVDVRGISFRRTASEAIARLLERTSRDLLYELRWRDVAPPVAADRAASGPWLIFADVGGVGDALAARLRQIGEQVTVVVRGPQLASLGPDRFQIDPAAPAQLRALLADIPAPRGVAHLWAIDRLDATDEGAPARGEANCASTLHLVQALLERRASPRLWLVTRGAQAAGESGATAPTEAMTWGIGRTLALEHRDLWGGLVDLDSHPQPAEVDQLLAELLSGKTGEQIALRGERRLVARLARATARAPHGPAMLRADGTYVIAGGTGGLGLTVARWMAARGAGHIVLASRHRPDPVAYAALEEIARTGSRLDHHCVDVADPRAVEALFEELARTRPPVRGIVQAAGVLADGLLRDLSWSDFLVPVAPKVAGTWNLHRASLGSPIDFFVLFSSVASLIGSVGQANYASANAFLDAFATFRRTLGLPALSIGWGAWADVGMAARSEERTRQRFAQSGIELMSPDTAGGVLDSLVGARVDGAIAAVSADWTRVRAAFAATELPLVDEMMDAPPARNAAAASAAWLALLPRLQAATSSRRRAMLLDHLREQVATIMGLEPHQVDPRAGFLDLGLDSIMALDLKDRLEADLGRPLPATLVFDYANLEALTSYVAESVVEGGETATERTAPVEARQSDAPTDGDDIDALSDAQMVELLARELDGREGVAS